LQLTPAQRPIAHPDSTHHLARCLISVTSHVISRQFHVTFPQPFAGYCASIFFLNPAWNGSKCRMLLPPLKPGISVWNAWF
jgi:hypothetical protein